MSKQAYNELQQLEFKRQYGGLNRQEKARYERLQDEWENEREEAMRR